MFDISDIKMIIYTEKSITLREKGVIVLHTSTRMTKNRLKQISKDYFGFTPISINSVNQKGKVKRFKGRVGKRADYKKFYIKVPEGADVGAFNV